MLCVALWSCLHSRFRRLPFAVVACLLLTLLMNARRYGHEHAAPELQKEAVYGLSELFRDKVGGACG